MLLVGLPGTGKTTLLRDLARQLGSGRQAVQVGLVDERGELAACVDGVPQLEVGERTDVLDGCPKTEAVAWFLRAMAPQVLITDELADASDAAAVLEAISEECPVPVVRVGIKDTFGHSGKGAELLKEYGLCRENIAAEAKRALKLKK